MKKILVIAALLVSAGGAIAGSDHYGSGVDPQRPATTTDTVHTASTKKGGPQTVRRPIVPNEEYGQGFWGH
ncbi:DUF680 domain-containing protein [Mesorhizobium sp. PL10]